MRRKGKIARLPPALRAELNLRLADDEDGATLRQWLNAIPGAHQQTNLFEWRQGGFRESETQQEMFDAARELAADASPVGATTNHDLATHLAAGISGKFATLLGTEDQAFDAKLRVLARFNQNLGISRRPNHIPLLSTGSHAPAF